MFDTRPPDTTQLHAHKIHTYPTLSIDPDLVYFGVCVYVCVCVCVCVCMCVCERLCGVH